MSDPNNVARQTRAAKAADASEQALMRRIMLAIGSLPDLYLWRNSPGKAEVWDPQTGAPRMLSFGVVGSADLCGILLPHGRFLGLEVKTATGRVEPHQEAWLARIRSFGGFACVVRSEAQACEAIARARQGLFE